MAKRRALIGTMAAGAASLLGVQAANGQAVLHPNASGSYAESFQQVVYDGLGWVDGDPRFVEGVRFEPRVFVSAGPGNPVLLTWSYLEDGVVNIPPLPGSTVNPMNDEGSQLFALLDANFDRGDWQESIARAFDRWEQISGINFQFVAQGGFASPTAPDGQDPDDYEPVDAGDPWPSIDQPQPMDGPEGYYDTTGLANDTDMNPSPPNTGVGDIRIGARTWDGQVEPNGFGAGLIFIDDPPAPTGLGLPNDGNIVLDVDEVWNDPLAPNLLDITMTRAIGFAVGLNAVCPQTELSVLEFQSGVDESGGPQTAPNPVPEPFPQLQLVNPTFLDTLAVQRLYGDPSENNDIFSQATQHDFSIIFDPEDFSLTFTPFNSLTAIGPISIAEKTDAMGMMTPDVDFFTFDIPLIIDEAMFAASLNPTGFIYNSQGNDGMQCSGPITAVDALREDNLSLTLQQFDPQTNVLQTIASVDAGGAGAPETLEVTLGPGRYYLIVAGLGTPPGTTNIQTFDLGMTLEVDDDILGEPIEDILDGSAPIGGLLGGIGRKSFSDPDTIAALMQQFFVPPISAGPFIGDSSVIVFMDQTLPFGLHNAFTGRQPLGLNWTGTNPSLDTVGTHSTATVAAAGGTTIPSQGFLGTAEPVELAAVNVARPGARIDGLFPISLEAVYFALFGLADAEFAASAGLTSPGDIFVAAWNAPNADPLGAGPTAVAHDAAVTAFDTLVITSAGNSGEINNIEDPVACGLANAEFIGGAFVGARTIGTPATAYNVLVVGASSAPGGVVDATFFGNDYALVPRVQSKGPLPTFDPTADGLDIVVEDARSGIHIVAPGYSFVQEPDPIDEDAADLQIEVCLHPGTQVSGLVNLPRFTADQDPTEFGGFGGSSLAASIVAGAAALLRDAAIDEGFTADQLVMKAVLMNSAVKQPGWSNNAAIAAPFPPHDKITELRITDDTPQIVVGDEQNLDLAQGAGLLDMEQAFLQFFLGARDVSQTDPLSPTVSQFTVASGGVPPDGFPNTPEPEPDVPDEVGFNIDRGWTPDGGGPGGLSPIEMVRTALDASRLSPEPEFFLQAQIGTPGGAPVPGAGTSSNFPSRPPAVLNIDNEPGPGDPGFDPIGSQTLRLFLEFNGLSDPEDPQSDATEFDPGINIDPVAQTSNEEDAVARFYIWAQVLGSQAEQNWNQISFSIDSVGDLEITDFEIFNYTADFGEVGAPQLRDRWDIVDPGLQVSPGRIENVNLFADTTLSTGAFGVSTAVDVIADDGHYLDDASSTLLGYIEIRGEGELFFEVGAGEIASDDQTPADSQVLFGFGDEFDPAINGSEIGVASSLRDGSSLLVTVLPVPIPVKIIGWDHGNLGVRFLPDPEDDDAVILVGFIDYLIEEPLTQGDLFAATLTWDRHTVVRAPDLTNLEDPNIPVAPIQVEFEDLAIDLLASDEFGNLLVDGEGAPFILAQSDAAFENVEHLLEIPAFDTFAVMRVRWSGTHFAVDTSTEEDGLEPLVPGEVEFGLAWATWNGPFVTFNDTNRLRVPEDNQNIPFNLPAAQQVVQLQDVLDAWGAAEGDANFNPAADLTGDGVVDTRDLNRVLAGQ